MASSLALLFPGQGSQVVGMGKDFFTEFKESRLVFEEASDATGCNLKKLSFDGPHSDLTLTENLQPALFTTEVAMMAAINARIEIKPLMTAGHSLGEYAALFAAGALSVADGAKLTRRRGAAMQKAVPVGKGTMAALLGLDSITAAALCRKACDEAAGEVVEPANFNAPGQVVIAGTIDGVAKAVELLKTDAEFSGGKSIPLQVSAPFHCSLMAPARDEMAPLLAATRFSRPHCLVIPNVTAMPTDSELIFGGLLTDQIVRPVQWEQSMKQLRGAGVTEVIEIGPGKVLSGLHKRIDREMVVRNISSVAQFMDVLGDL